MEQAKQIVNQNTGVQFCAVSESALFARCAAAELDAKQSKKLYGALWTAVIDAKTRNRRPDGTIITEEDEAREKAEMRAALEAKAALWKEREKTRRVRLRLFPPVITFAGSCVVSSESRAPDPYHRGVS